MHFRTQSAFTFGFIFLFSCLSFSYPAWISYGYNNCVACHYNGQGGGSLTDYGKAVWASELTAKNLFASNKSDEELGQNSGFPGAKLLPSQIKPGLKYRGLWFQNNPGLRPGMNKYITMQADLALALVFDEEGKYVFASSVGYSGHTLRQGGEDVSHWISREAFFRWQATEAMQLYFGLMDKAYGVRIVDHTAYSRSLVGLNKNDQTHGLMVQWIKSPWEYTAHIFGGNLSQDSQLRQKGFSFVVEKDIREKWRVGGSGMYSSNNFVSWTRAALHSKLGFSKGNSLISEAGLIQNKPKVSSAQTGLYSLFEVTSLLQRGYYLTSQFEYFNQTMSTKSPDQTRWSLGLMVFPMPRFEFRSSLVNGRSIQDSNVEGDVWQWQNQLHISM